MNSVPSQILKKSDNKHWDYWLIFYRKKEVTEQEKLFLNKYFDLKDQFPDLYIPKNNDYENGVV